MQIKLLNDTPERTFAIVLETGEELIECLHRTGHLERLSASRFTGIGAFRNAVLGFFDWEAKEYVRIPVDEQVEVVSLVGDVALKDGEQSVHAHVVVADSTGNARGGHLLEGHVRPTLELMLTESPRHLRRVVDERSGLALLQL